MLLVLLVTGWALAAPAGDGEPAACGLATGSAAPNFFVGTYNPKTSGFERVFLDRLVGDRLETPRKLVLLSFFNIDCKPCRKELPFLERLYRRYRDRDLMVVVVNCDFKQEKMDEVSRFVTDSGFTFPVLKDRFQALQRRYAVAQFPTLYLVDGTGTIVDVRVGYNEQTMPFPLAEVQRRLGVEPETLDEPPAPPPTEAPPPGAKTGANSVVLPRTGTRR